jgi:Ca-activated chloride channel family protein
MMIHGETVLWNNPHAWLVLPVFALLIFAVVHHYWSLSRWFEQLAIPEYQSMLISGANPWLRRLRFLSFVAVLGCLFVALCRPQWGKVEEVILREGRDVVVLLDISRSMQAADLEPTRLDAAKLKLKLLLSKLNYERLALILFSGAAFVQAPLTVDYPAFMTFLDQVDTEIIASGTTAVDKALLRAIELFDSSLAGSSKIILLVTDGEDFSTHLDTVAKKVKEKDIRLVAYGVGSEGGAPIPRKDNAGRVVGFERDAQGKAYLSLLNVPHLKKISEDLSGKCVVATEDDSDLDQIVEYIMSVEKKKFEDRTVSSHEERYPLAVGAAAVLYAINALV